MSAQGDSLAQPFDDSRITAVEYHSWLKDSFPDLPEDLAEAGASGKQGIGCQRYARNRALEKSAS